MKTFIVSLVLLSIVSCTSNDDDFEPQTITPILIGEGTNSGTAVKSNLVITNQADWTQLMNLLTPSNTNNFTQKNIDFTKFDLLVSIDGVRPSTGYSISISKVVENRSNVTATITSTFGGSGYTIFSQPFYIVKIPKSNKPIVFQ
jgi:hypothetical protein